MYVVTIHLTMGWWMVNSYPTHRMALDGLASLIGMLAADGAVITLPDGTDEHYDQAGKPVGASGARPGE